MTREQFITTMSILQDRKKNAERCHCPLTAAARERDIQRVLKEWEEQNNDRD